MNDKNDRLLQVIDNERAFFYQRENIQSASGKACRWKLIRQIMDYPSELDNKSDFLEFFSPDFSRYLYLTHEKYFVINDSITGNTLFKVPKDLMFFREDKPTIQIMNRILWLDQSRLQIVNRDGVEKIVHIDNNFEELAFNNRPLFNNINGKEWRACSYYR